MRGFQIVALLVAVIWTVVNAANNRGKGRGYAQRNSDQMRAVLGGQGAEVPRYMQNTKSGKARVQPPEPEPGKRIFDGRGHRVDGVGKRQFPKQRDSHFEFGYNRRLAAVGAAIDLSQPIHHNRETMKWEKEGQELPATEQDQANSLFLVKYDSKYGSYFVNILHADFGGVGPDSEWNVNIAFDQDQNRGKVLLWQSTGGTDARMRPIRRDMGDQHIWEIYLGGGGRHLEGADRSGTLGAWQRLTVTNPEGEDITGNVVEQLNEKFNLWIGTSQSEEDMWQRVRAHAQALGILPSVFNPDL